MAAFRGNREYIFPARFDSTRIPASTRRSAISTPRSDLRSIGSPHQTIAVKSHPCAMESPHRHIHIGSPYPLRPHCQLTTATPTLRRNIRHPSVEADSQKSHRMKRRGSAAVVAADEPQYRDCDEYCPCRQEESKRGCCKYRCKHKYDTARKEQ
jgi:hypothetical protein